MKKPECHKARLIHCKFNKVPALPLAEQVGGFDTEVGEWLGVYPNQDVFNKRVDAIENTLSKDFLSVKQGNTWWFVSFDLRRVDNEGWMSYDLDIKVERLLIGGRSYKLHNSAGFTYVLDSARNKASRDKADRRGGTMYSVCGGTKNISDQGVWMRVSNVPEIVLMSSGGRSKKKLIRQFNRWKELYKHEIIRQLLVEEAKYDDWLED